MGTGSAATISVVVPTRGRPEHAAACVASILLSAGFLEVIVVDQSDDDATDRALAAITDPRLRYVRTATRGASRGRNAGIAASRGSVIAFTDDDCRVDADWVSAIARCFDSDPEAALVCGRVSVPIELQAEGFAVSFEPGARVWQGHIPGPGRGWGVSANLSIRRDILDRIGAFDPFLGPGAPLLCGEDTDVIYRVLKSGMKVVNATEVVVSHLGVRRPGPELSALWRSYAVGTSAALFKHIRLGDKAATWLYLRHIWQCVWTVWMHLLRGRRPPLVRYTLQFLSGSFMSYRFRVDRDSPYYLPN